MARAQASHADALAAQALTLGAQAGGAEGASSEVAAALAAANQRATEHLKTIEDLQRELREAREARGKGGGQAQGGKVLQNVLGQSTGPGPFPTADGPSRSAGGRGGAGDGADSGAPPDAATQSALRSAEAALRERAEECAFLKHELGELQAALKRSEKGVDLTFLKNILVRCLKDNDLDNTLPAIAKALEMSAAEVEEIKSAQAGVLGEVGRVLRLW